MITNPSGLSFEDLQVGDSWQSDTRTIEQADIEQFANLTGDRDRLHIDQEFASRGPFGQTVAHGLLGMSILAGLSSTAPSVQTAALVDVQNWSFAKPIFPGDCVYAVTQVVELKPHGRRHGQVSWYRKLINQRGEKVQEGTLVTLVMRRAPLSTTPVRADAPHALVEAQTPLERGASPSSENSSSLQVPAVSAK
jgi:3-hydroxybutyryl-CoA dehydratase